MTPNPNMVELNLSENNDPELNAPGDNEPVSDPAMETAQYQAATQ